MTDSIWSNCHKCCRETKHKVLADRNTSNDVNYHYEIKYLIIECNGCENISFRKEFHDYEDYTYIDEDSYEHSISIEIFPHYISGHTPIKSRLSVPGIVRNIYEESIQAITEDAYTLAGLGLRATIEAICNDKQIKGKNLQSRINSMQRTGMISKSDADRLHAIRFMGNDAAHEIKSAKKESVLIALKIIEHMILSIYVFDKEVSKHLELPITSFDDALTVLKEKLDLIEPNTVFTLLKWLGDSRRRFEENLTAFETEIINKIESGDFPWVEVALSPENSVDTKVKWFKCTEVKLEKEKKTGSLKSIMF